MPGEIKLPTFERDSTFRDLLEPAMKIAQARDHEAAKAFMAAYRTYLIDEWDRTPEDADEVIRVNVGYYAGYYGDETQRAVLEVFGAAHPVFGTTRPTLEEAFDAGFLDAIENRGS